MEKRKDIDMLRFYGGDIHQKNKEGEYVITNNLVNPKNKEDMLWGDRDAYRTLNGKRFANYMINCLLKRKCGSCLKRKLNVFHYI